MKHLMQISKLTPQKYSRLYEAYGVKKKYFSYLLAVREGSNSPMRCTNTLISAILSISPQMAGRVTQELSSMGCIENVSAHPIRAEWRLCAPYDSLAEELLAISEGGSGA